MTDTRTACIVTHRAITRQPRIRREANLLEQLGYRVISVGANCDLPPSPDWQHVPIDYYSNELKRSGYLKLLAARWLTGPLPGLVDWTTSMWPGSVRTWQAMRDLCPSLVIAHNHHLLPEAARLARSCGVPFTVDLHEFSTGMEIQDTVWRIFERPYVRAILKKYLPLAAHVTTVSGGLADAFASEFSLATRPTVVRNVPSFEPDFADIPFRPTGERIEILYHGIAAPNDLLETVIHSVPLWRPEFRLRIRSGGRTEYIKSLKDLIGSLGLDARITFEEMVPMDRVSQAANRSDIGIFITDRTMPQRKFSLPNKFFEYIMGGIAVCVSDLPDMARIVREYDLGVLVSQETAETLAVRINGLDRAQIDRHKRNAIRAAGDLNWGVEQEKLRAIYQEGALGSAQRRRG